MSERANVGRQSGEPLIFDIDLRWALWSTDESLWADYAPETLKHLKGGFDGDFDEHGDTVMIRTAPRKEIRFGTVIINPKSSLVQVVFWSDYDDGSRDDEDDSFPLPDTFEEFMAKVDQVESRLIDKERAAG